MSFVENAENRGHNAGRVFLALGIAIVLFLIGGFWWATSVPGTSYAGPAAHPRDGGLAQRLRDHVEVLASSPRSLDHQSTITSPLAYLEGELRDYGYAPIRQEVVPPADNLSVNLPARTEDAPILVVGAHYDTVPRSPGADDNASGVASLLEIARALKSREGQSDVELILVFYANEEPPYFKTRAMGSFAHAQSLAEPERVIGMISLETMGYYSDVPGSQNYPFPLSLRYPSRGNFIAFAGDTSSRDFLREMIGEFRGAARIPSVGGTAPSIVQGIDWSDHWSYSQVGIPAFMVTDTAIFRNPNYHKKSDLPDTLDYRRLALVVEGLVEMIEAKMREGGEVAQ